jgi:hypothetical protein
MKLNIGQKFSELWAGFSKPWKIGLIAFGVLVVVGLIYQIAAGDPGPAQ